MDPATIIMGLAALASAIGGIAGSAKQSRYAEEQSREQERQQAEIEKRQKQQALAKALKSQMGGLLDRPATMRTVTPPNMAGPAALQGLGNLGMFTASQFGPQINTFFKQRQAQAQQMPQQQPMFGVDMVAPQQRPFDIYGTQQYYG